jgi:hypothetical protein
MNKKLNTVLFVLGASAFNVIVTIVIALGLFVLASKTIFSGAATPDGLKLFLMLDFIGSVVLASLLYKFLIDRIVKKFDVDKYFEPIFGKGKKKLPR